MSPGIFIAAAVCVAAVVVIIAVRRAVISAKRRMSQLSGLIGQIQQVTEQTQTTPRTLSGSEGLMLMKIKRDFPEFNEEVARQIVTAALGSYFTVLSERSGTQRLEEYCTDAFISHIEGQIVNGSFGFSQLKIHRTVISDYRRTGSEAVITYQSAVEYAPLGKGLMQYVYELRYVYFLEEDGEGENVSLKCSYCGAPISTVGEKVCIYCGAQIEASVERTWRVNDIRKLR